MHKTKNNNNENIANENNNSEISTNENNSNEDNNSENNTDKITMEGCGDWCSGSFGDAWCSDA